MQVFVLVYVRQGHNYGLDGCMSLENGFPSVIGKNFI